MHSRWFLVLALFAFMPSPVSLLAQEPPPAADAQEDEAGGETPAPTADQSADDVPGVQIPVSLTNGVFQRRLPFDVPFYVRGAAPTFANQMTLSVYWVGRRSTLTDVATAMRATQSCEPAAGADVRRVSRSTWRRSDKAQQFLMLVDALAPQRYYVFCFLMAGPVPFSEIAAPVRANLAEATFLVLGKDDPGDLRLPLARNFHTRLAEFIAKLGAGREVQGVIPAGNLFSSDTPIERNSRFVVLMAALQDPYQEMGRIRANYTTRLSDLQAAVKTGSAAAPKFLTESVLAVLPTDANQLPDRNEALRNASPFVVSPFEFSEARAMIEDAIKEADTAKDEAAAKVLRDIRRHLNALSDFGRTYGIEYESVRDATQQILDHVALEAREVRVGFGSSVLTADMNRNAYVSLDLGLAYAWDLQNMVFYAGTNIYFRPINKNAPLGRNFWRRFALTIGITTSVEDDSRRAGDLRTSADENGTNS
ncbi:MAG TPA: hypothetical protein VFO67_12150, partial [Gemmatimonadales bacterium]|nr:hypothetical protein [Gemmatimonadales bacterium]